MNAFVAYHRVSTYRQGESGLGVEAKRAVVAHFRHGASLLSEFPEIEGGKRHINRLQLAAAFVGCRRATCLLALAVMLSGTAMHAQSYEQCKATANGVDVQLRACDAAELKVRDMVLNQTYQ